MENLGVVHVDIEKDISGAVNVAVSVDQDKVTIACIDIHHAKELKALLEKAAWIEFGA